MRQRTYAWCERTTGQPVSYSIINFLVQYALLIPTPIDLNIHSHILPNATVVQQIHYVRSAKGHMFSRYKSCPAAVIPAGSTLE